MFTQFLRRLLLVACLALTIRAAEDPAVAAVRAADDERVSATMAGDRMDMSR